LGEVGLFHPVPDAPFMTAGAFLVDQQRQAFFKGQFGILRVFELFLHPIVKGGEVKLGEFVE
jgi:hypothetical protein